MTKIYTKTGDDGTTFVPKSGRVSKHTLSVKALGDLDELNAWIGMLRRFADEPLKKVQCDLLEIGAQLATGEQHIRESDIVELEYRIDLHNLTLPELKNFILPSYPAEFHVARAVCRRAERSMSEWQASDLTRKFRLVIAYLNRLSDYLFVLARTVAKQDEVWKSKKDEAP